jgi:hypothetical protein
MGKLHDFPIRPQIMLFSCFSVKEVLDSSYLVPPSRLLSDYRIHSDALCYVYLYVLIDQDSFNVLRPYMVLTNGCCAQFRSCHAKNVWNILLPRLRRARLNTLRSLGLTLPSSMPLLRPERAVIHDATPCSHISGISRGCRPGWCAIHNCYT